MGKSWTFRWELHRGQKIWSVQDSGATRVAFKEDVDATREEVSAEIGTESMADKLVVESNGVG